MTVAGERDRGRGQLVLAISTSNSNWLASLSKSMPCCHFVVAGGNGRRGGGRNAEKTFAGTLKMLEVHRTPFSVVVTLLCS